MMQALANLIHSRSEEKQNSSKNGEIPIVPINYKKHQVKEKPEQEEKNHEKNN